MSILSETLKIGRHEVGNAWIRIVVLAAILAGLLLVMMGLNLADMRGTVLFLTMLSAAALSVVFFSPKMFLVALGLGAAAAELDDKDLSQGAANGVRALVTVWQGVVLTFLASGAILGAIPFQNSPRTMAIVFLLMLATAIVVTKLDDKARKKFNKWLAIFFLAILALSLWNPGNDYTKETVGVDLREQSNSFARSAKTTNCTAADYVDGMIDSTSTPVRFEAKLGCRSFIPSKTAEIPVWLSYNQGPWKKWESGNAPMSTETVRTMDVRLVNPGAVYIKVAFGS